ncbi:hypothetical protein SLS60_002433 [Paraconiothyrium brasiliense]|uniref:Glycoside hydrolase family 28 protein n=1 Tax=Paraconiothyrium brasiliense TaxID=300254 RepID=A0ABR3S246_9PLEO
MDTEKLREFKKIDHIQHREDCEKERGIVTTKQSKLDLSFDANDKQSFMDFDDEETVSSRIRKMLTRFPYRDPIYLVAVVFALGSLDLVINAFFDLLPRTAPETAFETEDTVAVPATVLIGSILFFAAGIFDVFGALNADRGTLETSKEDLRAVTYKPALLGSPEFKWLPSKTKLIELSTTSLAFQAGLIVLFGGVIFMFAGIVDFPGIVSEESSLFASIVFGPQVIHGFLFLVANAMLAISEQDKWYIPKIADPDWQGATLNATGGFWFMMAGFFEIQKDEFFIATMRYFTLLPLAFFSATNASSFAGKSGGKSKVCTVAASGTNLTDDAPAIRSAFSRCNHGGSVVFNASTYYVNSVLNITGLDNVDVDIRGKLLWNTNISYWLNHSLPVGYQNQSTAFVLSGNNVRIDGHGSGNLDGNGDYWYQWIKKQPNTSNYPGRPHQITFNGLTNSVIKGLSFFRSQMWTMSIINSHNSILEDILVNNTGNVVSSSNTDGANTMFSSNITMKNWTVYNGDDSIAIKANSTNISILDSKFYNGLGIAIGSIGQYFGHFETIQNLRAENIQYVNTLHAFYVKTWTADQNGYPPNGGGGGIGFAEDLYLKNLTVEGLRGAAFAISQCTRFSGAPGVGNCTNSQFQIRDVGIDGMKGTSKSSRVASLQCSAEKPCTDITLENIDLKLSNGSAADSYLCGNVVDAKGWKCTGKVCEGGSATGEC